MTDFLAAAKLHYNWAISPLGFIKANGRVQNNYYTNQAPYGVVGSEANLTEGESYAMLMAVWMNDFKTFDSVWQWLKANMQLNATVIANSRQGTVAAALDVYHDSSGNRAFTDLGRTSLKTFGWIHKTNWNTVAVPRQGLAQTDNATDGDTFIAIALLLAAERWQMPAYRAEGLAILADLQTFNVRPGGANHYLNFGAYIGNDGNPVYAVDPSYLVPWMWYTFAVHDPTNVVLWNNVADNIYPLFTAAMNTNFWHMPPYQVGVNRSTGAFTSYGPDENFDAFRCWINFMMDNDTRGTAIMNDLTRGKYQYAVANGKVPEQMANNGTVTFNGSSPNYSPWGCCELFAQMYALGVGITMAGTHFADYDAFYTGLPANVKQNAAGWFFDSSDYYANWPWFQAFYAIGSGWRRHHNMRKWLIFSAGTLAANKASFDTANAQIITDNGLSTYSGYYIYQDNIQVAIPIWGNASISLTVPQRAALVAVLPTGVWSGPP